jgi:hypothetical protein
MWFQLITNKLSQNHILSENSRKKNSNSGNEANRIFKVWEGPFDISQNEWATVDIDNLFSISGKTCIIKCINMKKRNTQDRAYMIYPVQKTLDAKFKQNAAKITTKIWKIHIV